MMVPGPEHPASGEVYPMKPMAYMALIVSGLTVLVLFLLGGAPNESVSEVANGNERAESSARDASSRSVVRDAAQVDDDRRRSLTDSSGGVIIEVSSSLGPLLEGSQVMQQKQGSRWVAKSGARALGSTDARGRVLVPKTVIDEMDKDSLLVFKTGFLPVSIKKDEVFKAQQTSGILRVTLSAGIEQAFEFRLEDGTPVPGQTILLSRCGTFPARIEDGYAGGNYDAIFSATSDQSGKASFNALEPGEYVFRVVENSLYGIVSGPVRRGPLRVPCANPSFTLRQVLAAGLIVRGDRVVGYNAQFLGSSQSNGGNGQLQRLAEQQKDRWATPLFWTAFRKGAAPARVKWQILFERSGLQKGELELQPLTAKGWRPKLIRPAANAPLRPSGQVLIDWRGSGRMPAMILTEAGRGFHPGQFYLRVRVEPNKPYRIPVGRYQLKAQYRSARRVIQSQVVVVHEGKVATCRLPVSAEYEICTLEVLNPNEVSVGDVSVSIFKGDSVDGEAVWGRYLKRPGPVGALLPRGDLVIRVEAQGYRTLVKPLLIKKGQKKLEPLRMEWPRR